MTTGPGAGSRQSSHGHQSTRRVDSTMPAAATCASQPTVAADGRCRGAKPTAIMPAICVTVISGMAAKFSRSPATVTREKCNAPIGKSASSAQIVAASSPAGAATRRRTAAGSGAARSPQRISRATPSSRPAVAPNVNWNPGSSNDSGSTATRHPAASANVLSGSIRWSAASAARKITAANTARVTDASSATTCA